MDEETVWRKYSASIKENNTTKMEPRDLRIQEIDNGFFERFGTLLKDQNAKDISEPEDDNLSDESEIEEEKEIVDSEREEIISNLIGINIDELYAEVLYEILHIIGTDANNENKDELFTYLKETFKIDDEKHEEFFKLVKEKEAPNILLNVEVIQGKDLAPKDANGLSDPFCTLYLSNVSTHRYNTSVKSETLNPTWEEHFSLSIVRAAGRMVGAWRVVCAWVCVYVKNPDGNFKILARNGRAAGVGGGPVENTAEDVLIFEVWDFDPAETVREKITKITEVKGVKGLRKLMKEIAVTASTGKHDNEIIGTVKIPLKSVPSSGHVKWYSLEKKSRNRGAVKLKLAFSSEKNSQVAAQEHRHLLRFILLQEMEHNKPDFPKWNGKFTGPAEIILRQHATQCGLRLADEKMAEWVEFIRLHQSQPLNFQLFATIIAAIKDALSNGLYSEDEVRLFWDGVKKLLPSIFQKLRKIRKTVGGDKTQLCELDAMLRIISTVTSLDSDQTDLFPQAIYAWLQCPNLCQNDALANLKLAIRQSTDEWFQQIVENNRATNANQENRLQQAIKITNLVRNDLQKSIELYDMIFYITTKIQYSMDLYRVFDGKICELTKPLVGEICSNLKPLKFKGNLLDIDKNNADYENLTIGTSLFELYLALQKLLVLGRGIFPMDIESFQISKYHIWFHLGVAHWLDIAMYKAMQRIEKAVDLDELIPVDASVKYSSSAVDTLSIFYQIKVFWKQLSWPDIEGAFTFVAKIMDDICRCSVHYADKMGDKVATMGDSNAYGKQFEVTNEWCLAINNIDYVRQSIEPFVNELGLDDIVQKLSAVNTETAADHCKQTLLLVIDNAVDTVKNKIIDLLDMVAIKMAPVAKRFLLEGAEILNQDNNHIERLMQYLDSNLITLHSQLNNDNFERILTILWDKVYDILTQVVNDSLEKRRPPNFFENLSNTLSILVGFFKQSENVENNDSYKKIKHILELHGMGTEELIHKYYLDRLLEQNSPMSPTYGMLTIRMQFVHYMLRIEILNARNLLPHDSNGSCDPFVKMHLLPEEKFTSVVKPKTKIHKKNLFPLFDETFTIQLSKDQYELPNGILHLIVKDEDFLGMSSQFVAEAFVLLSEIPRTTMETSLHEMAQVHLKLTKPTNQDTNIIKVLEHRQGEKLAKDFIKKLKTKMVVPSNNVETHNGN
ncbi:C2 and C2B_Munc13-like domain-containing protein staccato isoform X3 [Rhodnius prolixus]|uniref:C2 and C2B_Munc13-like domain-containing protein staccato isoform X3 n=1 Tax=Rhodnius prolixus TaxID=13249 RepID=UPI003D189F96